MTTIIDFCIQNLGTTHPHSLIWTGMLKSLNIFVLKPSQGINFNSWLNIPFYELYSLVARLIYPCDVE